MKETKYEVTGENGQEPSVFEYLRQRGEYQYPTEDLLVYSKALAKMNTCDLQQHSMDKGIRPSNDRNRLITLLTAQFKATIQRKKANAAMKSNPHKRKEEEERQRLKGIERNHFLRGSI